MRRLLLVDDEENVTKGMQRSLPEYLKEYQIYAVNSARDGLKLLSQNDFDMVISDVMMPEMNGADFLLKVQNEYPLTLRCVLSGHVNKDLFFKASACSHMHLSKPYDAVDLAEKVKLEIQHEMDVSRTELRKILSRLPDLPPIPGLYKELQDVSKSDEKDISIVANVINKDSEFVARVLKIANSDFFENSGRITTVEEAIFFLGTDIVKNLVLLVHFAESLQIPLTSGFNSDSHRMHSVRTGMLIKKMGDKYKIDASTLRTLSTVSTLHDIGKLVLASAFADKYKRVQEKSLKTKMALWKAEKEEFGTSHAEVGASLLELWNFPKSITELIEFHHSPIHYNGANKEALFLLHIANHLDYTRSGVRPSFTPDKMDVEWLRSFNNKKDILKDLGI